MGERAGIEIAETLPGEPDQRPLSAGDRAGEYEIVRQLGAGAMGEVYEGRHPIIGKRVAIKVIKQVLARSEESAQRFVREAKAVNQIGHPNVVDVFAFGRLDDGRLYLVMDLLQGQTLEDHLRRKGSLSVDEFAAIMEPMCRAVAAAHEAGIVHRDLKPANVFLADVDGADGHKVVVLDFGVAKLMSSAQEQTGHTLTGQGAWIGTPVYMAPEQWTEEGASPRSDVYALGAIGYELLSGSSPFVADSIPGVMQKHFHAAVPPIRDTGKSLPAHIDDALQRAMAKDPADRFATALELWEALSGAGSESSTRRPISRSRNLAPAAMGAALILAGAGALFALDGDGGERRTAAAPERDPDDRVTAGIDSLPSGASVMRGGELVGKTPLELPCDPDETVEVEVFKPGYVPRTVSASAGRDVRVELPAVRGFEGVWKLSSGELRRFERRGDRVVAYRLSALAGEGELYRFFDFVDPSDVDAGVVFEASAEHVDESHPNSPSCRVQLKAQYHYVPSANTMRTRREKLDYRVVDGDCVIDRRTWSPFEKVAALDESGDGERRRTVVSHAGGTGDGGDGSADVATGDSAQLDSAQPPMTPNILPQKRSRKAPPRSKKDPKRAALERKKQEQLAAERARRQKQKNALERPTAGDLPIAPVGNAPPPQQKQPASQEKQPPVQVQGR